MIAAYQTLIGNNCMSCFILGLVHDYLMNSRHCTSSSGFSKMRPWCTTTWSHVMSSGPRCVALPASCSCSFARIASRLARPKANTSC